MSLKRVVVAFRAEADGRIDRGSAPPVVCTSTTPKSGNESNLSSLGLWWLGRVGCQFRTAALNSVGYVDVSVWGKSGEACAHHLSRGWLVGVTGRLEYREWPADDGSKRSAHAVVGNVDFLSAPRASADEEPAAA